MTRDELQPGTLVLVPHGGKRIGWVLARVLDVPPNSGKVRVARWRPSQRAFSAATHDVPDSLVRPVPANDRRLERARKATETTP